MGKPDLNRLRWKVLDAVEKDGLFRATEIARQLRVKPAHVRAAAELLPGLLSTEVHEFSRGYFRRREVRIARRR